jgi:basic membrane protein A
MKKLLTVLLALFLVVSLTACSKGNDDATPSDGGDTPAETTKKKVAVLVPFTGDNSYFDTLARGVTKANELYGDKVEVVIKEVGNTTEKAIWDNAFDEFCEGGDYDLVVSGNNSYEEYLYDAAERYPDQAFMNFDASTIRDTCTNVYNVNYGLGPLGYVVGTLSAEITKTNRVGVLLGMDIQPMNQFIGGWCQALSERGVEFIVDYVVSTTPFQDQQAGYEQTKDIIAAGADVVWQVAGGTGNGVIQACAENPDVWCVGVDQDQYGQFLESQPDWAKTIITSAQKNSDVVLAEVVKMVVEGTFNEKLGKTEAWSLDTNGVGLSNNEFYQANVSEEIRAKVDQAVKDIQDGKITVVDTLAMSNEEYASWTEWRDANKVNK